MNKTRIPLLLMLVVLLTVTAGCAKPAPQPAVNTHTSAMAITAYCAVPFASERDLSKIEVTELETDDFGKILFSVREQGCRGEIDALVIMQAYDNARVSYFDGICFTTSGSEDAIEKLKTDNMWNEPADVPRMVNRNVKVTEDGTKIGQTTVFRDEEAEILMEGIPGVGKLTDHVLLAADTKAGYDLYWMKAETDDGMKEMCVILKSDITVIKEEIGEDFDLIEFKNRNGI